MESPTQDFYFKNGYLDPFTLLEKHEIEELLLEEEIIESYIQKEKILLSPKSRHAVSSVYYKIATNPSLLGKVKEILGDNIGLAFAHFIKKEPKQKHRWHVDVEFLGNQQSVTVWIGLQNISSQTSIQLIPKTHSAPPIQTLVDPDSQYVTEKVVEAASEYFANAQILSFDSIKEGEAVIFHPLIWHGSENKAESNRCAIILQYCNFEVPVKIPLSFGSKVVYLEDYLPPCIVVSGVVKEEKKKDFNLVPAPMQSIEANIQKAEVLCQPHWNVEAFASLKKKLLQ